MEWPVEIEIPVPWRDVDVAGHVNNAVYFSYMETARLRTFLLVRGLPPDTVVRDVARFDMILARAECDFVSPAFMNETLVVSVRPTRVGASSFAFGYAIREKRTGRLVAKGESVQVMFDYAANAKKPVPPEMRAALEAGLQPTA